MEWNAKSPSQWDWEQHLIFCNAKATENPKLQLPRKANGRINVGLLDASGGGSVCSGSELIHASSSRSSKSASINSSSNKDSKTSLLTFESSQEPVENSHALEPSSVSREPLLTLKLGKRFYFEDVYPGSGSKNQSSSEAPMSPLITGKKGRSNSQNVQRCQVEGCGLDLSSAKDYHRKHRVCESHSKSPKVVVAGLEKRFCQQCSRFHSLPEFDEKKRSCRRRLSDHNARRRKSHSEAVHVQYNPSDGRQQHVSPFSYSRAATNLAWQDTRRSKLPQTKDFLMNPAKPYDEIPSVVTMLSHDVSKSVNPGVEDSITSSDPSAAQDFHRALSLLSTNSWGSCSNHAAQPITHAMSQRLPLASTEYWHTDQQQPVNSSMWITYPNCDDNNRFQEFQLFREPYESAFPYDQLD